MSVKHAVTAAIWLLCLYAPVVAQDERPLKVKIIESVGEREPEWLFSRGEEAHSDVNGGTRERTVLISLDSRHQSHG